jgi:hypothetical protein
MTIRISSEQSQKLNKFRLAVKTAYDPLSCQFDARVRDSLTGEEVTTAKRTLEQQAVDDAIEAISDRHEPMSRLEMESRLKELENEAKPRKKRGPKKKAGSSASVVRPMHDSAKDDD